MDESKLLDEVIRRVRKRRGPARKARTLKLGDANYQEFEENCKVEKIYPSDVLDEFIALFNEARRKRNANKSDV